MILERIVCDSRDLDPPERQEDLDMICNREDVEFDEYDGSEYWPESDSEDW